MISINEFINILKNWQSILGAFLGAATPISFWFYIEWNRRREKQKESLYYVERLLVYNINAVIESHKTIKIFIENHLARLIEGINQATEEGRYATHTAFLPLFSYPVDEGLFNISTNSDYLDNKLLQACGMTKDFSLAIEDLRNQFSSTIETNQKMAFDKLNGPKAQNEEFKKNVQEFIRIIERDLFEKNEKVYLKILISTRITAKKLYKIGLWRWRMKFSSSFKFFINKKRLEKFRKEAFDHIDDFFKEEVDAEVRRIEEGLIITPTMTINEKKSALDPLWYELWMFNETSKYLILHGEETTKEKNVYLESFLIHARNIIDFLEDKKYDNDIRCSDFEIAKVVINLPKNNTKTEINRWLSHITKERIEKEKPDWEYSIIRDEVNKCFKNFLNELPNDCFPSMVGRSRSDFEYLLN
jgi:hypothetical protein